MGAVLVNWNPKEFVKDIFKDQKDFHETNWVKLLGLETIIKLEKGLLNFSQVINSIKEEELKYNVKKFFKELPKYLHPIKDGLEIFNSVKKLNYKTYILSNFEEELLKASSKQHNYNQFLNKFDGIVFSCDVKSRKPEPKIYHTLLNDYNLNAQESFFIDDMPENIEGAKKLGIDGVVCKNHDIVLQTLKDLKIL